MSKYLSENLPAAFKGRETLPDYRANPYVLMTSASVMKLNKPLDYARFLFNNKLYMALETSFGKSFGIVLSHYPTKSRLKWEDPPEKRAEHKALAGRTREQKARLRTESVWREIDKSVVVGNRRYLTSIKSGPNTINDSTAQAMASAIIANHRRWADQTRVTYPNVSGLDVVIGLTYGTDRTTNNKENQILVKLLERGFEEEDHAKKPGVLIDGATQSTRVYRKIGAEFWAFVGDPGDPTSASFVFLEILLALAKALSTGIKTAQLEDRINTKIQELRNALASLQFQRNSLPGWLREDFSEEELFWFATAMTAFYDEGV
ncbi:MAG TPA: PmeII family type II restriction endonuclease [Methylomirabilota bacterium]|nr:PmeII family type II restriction endonuclease [Methylomirabilota bacterium]